MEMEKAYKRLELEKVQLQGNIEEMEASFQQEVGKVQRAQIEITTVKGEFDRRLAEKDEEVENIRYGDTATFRFQLFLLGLY